MGCFRQEYWSRLPFPSPGDLPDPEVEPHLLYWQADSLPLSHQGSQKKKKVHILKIQTITTKPTLPSGGQIWKHLYSFIKQMIILHIPKQLKVRQPGASFCIFNNSLDPISPNYQGWMASLWRCPNSSFLNFITEALCSKLYWVILLIYLGFRYLYMWQVMHK